MKKHIPVTLLFAAILSFSCGNSNNRVNKNTDTVTTGNTDSFGSQPVQPVTGSASGGNPTDSIAHGNSPAPRVDSVVRH